MTFAPRQKLTAKAMNDLLALATDGRNTALASQNAASAAQAAADAAKAAADQKAPSAYRSPNSLAAARSINAKLADLPMNVSDFSAEELVRGSARRYEDYSAERIYRGPDGSIQFSVGWTQLANERWHIVGGQNGHGATLVVLATAADADGNIVVKGKGGIYFGNGSGMLAAVEDNESGKRPANYAALRPGDGGNPAQIIVRSWAGEANAGLALTPLGNGAITRNVPDGATAGGNARGIFAVDLQGDRSSSQHVASSSYSAVLSGTGNMAANVGAVSIGGSLNSARGPYTSTLGGVRGDTGNVHGKAVHSSGRVAVDGDAQQAWNELRGTSTSAAPVRLTADGAAAGANNIFNFPNNSSMRIKGSWIASQTGGTAGTAGDTAGGDWAITVKRYGNAANTFKVANATVTKEADAPAAAWNLTVDVDNINGGLNINFVGEANKNVKAVATIHSSETIR